MSCLVNKMNEVLGMAVPVKAKYLYHGTIYSRAKKIVKSGFLQWKRSEHWGISFMSVRDRVYLTASASDAARFASDAADHFRTKAFDDYVEYREGINKDYRKSEEYKNLMLLKLTDAAVPEKLARVLEGTYPAITVIQPPEGVIEAQPDEDHVEIVLMEIKFMLMEIKFMLPDTSQVRRAFSWANSTVRRGMLMPTPRVSVPQMILIKSAVGRRATVCSSARRYSSPV